MENRKVKFRLKIPYQQLSGNESLREVLCSNDETLVNIIHYLGYFLIGKWYKEYNTLGLNLLKH
jgi:hypothetical protein